MLRILKARFISNLANCHFRNKYQFLCLIYNSAVNIVMGRFTRFAFDHVSQVTGRSTQLIGAEGNRRDTVYFSLLVLSYSFNKVSNRSNMP
ncbi:hypothetical protein SAMN05661012_00293 [Chitinophaga sancti]|uniref:Uncharacterized protein n=1 Tax=Chitinophaga sancti TaxID=1004 RepID=A0A1K1M0K7_9BACT|nr:hypothetical protein SAMN05661012_00293 [Chitinophaga sancti]